ncbi:capsule assembly Wzi family protein [Edaphobacter aggregans]|uniref:capsule assembly Wzi family protein n=1 Tax=Edaphobacter aggregans TaxID=570835 RepID=UPI00068CD5C5|nr:capsule assembly Wzi family protein [Edaphobacter aggregans]
MHVTPKRLFLPLFFWASLLIQPSAFAQNAALSSSALPDAPEPQNTPASPAPAKPATPQPEDITLSGTPKRLLRDQEAIWTSPLRLKPKDAIWLVPFGTATGLLISTDQHTMTQAIHLNSSDQSKANTVSNGALVGIGAIPVSTYLWSLFNHSPQAHETGLLAGEALVNGLAVNEALKLVLRRERPPINNAAGDFFSSKWNDGSFPSNHAVLAWSMASVIASEYPGWLTRTAVYGLAGTVSVSRVLSYQHFPSDVLVGSVTGWLIGRYVYHAHHDYTLNPYETPPLPENYIAHTTGPSSSAGSLPAPPPPRQFALLPPDPIPNRTPPPFDADPDTIGSTNVPMDSWIYPALERLAALGLIPTQSISIRPWTRQECLRQLHQAQEIADRVGNQAGFVREARRLMPDLERELSTESTSYQELALESVYARYGTIAGPALADSFHFGQTWWNDFGRPLGRGSSFIAGFSTRAHYGRLFFYAREEYQHSPGNPAETPERNALINQLDRIEASDPFIQPIPGRSAYERQRPLELYGGVAFAGNALSFGKQALYWGPTTMGPLALSSNAEPTYNFRFVSTRPHPLPLVPSLGTYRFDIVLGKLSGHSYPERPWFNGQKIDFNFGSNLEISFTRWSVFWGVGHPITLHSFKENLFSFSSTGSYVGNGAAPYGDRNDPGDRKSNFDFRYKLPFLRRIVTLYADAYSDDDPNPIAAPRRAVWNPGIYFARLPFLPHMDLRVEAVSSTGLATDFGGQHFFMNNQYLDSNTNKGFMLGNAIGRDARAIEGRSGYWFSARTRIEGGYRQNKGGIAFLPGGATITDGFINGSYAINRHWQAQVFTQYERFLIPSYMNGSQHNTSGWFQVTWTPDFSVRQ